MRRCNCLCLACGSFLRDVLWECGCHVLSLGPLSLGLYYHRSSSDQRSISRCTRLQGAKAGTILVIPSPELPLTTKIWHLRRLSRRRWQAYAQRRSPVHARRRPTHARRGSSCVRKVQLLVQPRRRLHLSWLARMISKEMVQHVLGGSQYMAKIFALHVEILGISSTIFARCVRSSFSRHGGQPQKTSEASATFDAGSVNLQANM